MNAGLWPLSYMSIKLIEDLSSLNMPYHDESYDLPCLVKDMNYPPPFVIYLAGNLRSRSMKSFHRAIHSVLYLKPHAISQRPAGGT